VLAQETQWLADDLAGDHKDRTIAYWHQPTFTAADTSADVPDPGAPGLTVSRGWPPTRGGNCCTRRTRR
jgi:hypothetical protein